MKHKYTWKKQHPDLRDYKFSKSPIADKVKVEELPKTVNLRRWCSVIEDQGQLGSCFPGDTLVPLLNGKIVPIKELAEGVHRESFWIYSNKNSKTVPALASASLTRRNAKIYTVTLTNGKSVKCTGDHEFLMRDNTYKKVTELNNSDSIMSFRRVYNNRGYESVYCHEDHKFRLTHWMVGNYIYGYRPNENGIEVIHHIDFNHRNNTPENLQGMTIHDHCSYHSKLAGWKHWNGTEKQIEHSKRQIRKQYLENPSWNAGAASKGGKEAWRKANLDNAMRERMLEGFEKGRYDKDIRKRATEALKVTIKNRPPEEKERISKILSEIQMRPEKLKITRETGKKLGGVKSLKFQISKHASYIIHKNRNINDDTWKSSKKERNIYNIPNWNTAVQVFGSVDELKSAGMNYNHRIVEVIDTNTYEDVYCLNVPETHNFALDAGIFVHNCTSFAWAGLLQYNINKEKTGPYVNLSKLFIYYNERDIEGTINDDSGAELRDGAKALATYGVCPEFQWPYKINDFRNKPTDIIYKNALPYKITNYYALNTFDDLKISLAAGHPFVFGFTVYESFESDVVTNTGVVPMPNLNTEKILGGHAVMCFTGDTKISLMSGTEVSLKELSETKADKKFWVYSCDESGNVVPGLAHSPRKTGVNQPLLRVKIDNGEEIRCTLNHQFLMRDGTYKEAKDLIPNDSLMPLYRKKEIMYGKSDYEMFLNPRNEKWYYTHRSAILNTTGRYNGIVHHIDLNRFNNDLENLKVMTWDEHTNLHKENIKLLINYSKSDAGREKSRQLMNKLWADPTWKLKALQRVKDNGKKVAEMVKYGIIESGLKNVDHSLIGKLYGSKNVMSLHTEESKRKSKEARKLKFSNDIEFREKSKRIAIENIKKYNDSIKSGKVKPTEKQINARSLNGKRVCFNRWGESKVLDSSPINHKVVSIELCGSEDVYDITVEKYHNFALSSGVFVHNCIGYNDIQKRFLVRNSWGGSWGLKGTLSGYFTIGYSYLANSDLAGDFWTCI